MLDQDKTQHLGVVKYGIESLERRGTCPALGNPKYIAEYLYWMEHGGRRPKPSEMIGQFTLERNNCATDGMAHL